MTTPPGTVVSESCRLLVAVGLREGVAELERDGEEERG